MPIMLRITIYGKRINLPTNIWCLEKSWDKNKQAIKGNSDLILKFNQLFQTVKSKAWDYYSECIREGKLMDIKYLKDRLNGIEKRQHTILQALDYQISVLKSRVGHDIAPATVKKYETVKRKVIEFLGYKKWGDDKLLSELNYHFIYELDLFMRVSQGLQNNGVIKNLQQLKRVIKVAQLNEWMTYDPFANM
ncbi:MAG: hypothetical protein NVS9B7_01510 [Flavisolibacter sp.]